MWNRLKAKSWLRVVIALGLVLILLGIAALLTLHQAGREIYFVSGCPFSEGNVTFPADLYVQQDDSHSLRRIRNVLSSEVGTEWICCYQDQRVVLLSECHLGALARHQRPKEGEVAFAVIDMDSPSVPQDYKIVYDGYTPSNWHLLEVPNEGLYQTMWILARSREAKPEDNFGVYGLQDMPFLGVHLPTGTQSQLDHDYYRYAVLSGASGPAVQQEADILILNVTGENELYDRRMVSRMDWNLPESFIRSATQGVQPIGGVMVCVENRELRVIRWRLIERKDRKELPYFILNKATGQWNILDIDGDNSGIRAYNHWVAGYIMHEEAKESPGKDKRRQAQTETGYPFDWRIMERKMYFPGILFLYDIRTGKKYTIETNQGDSEILLVEEGIMYYRVNDRILKAKIGKESIGEPELVVEGEIVPDIHWAFMGPEIGTTQ